jgi:hypothetical protein
METAVGTEGNRKISKVFASMLKLKRTGVV